MLNVEKIEDIGIKYLSNKEIFRNKYFTFDLIKIFDTVDNEIIECVFNCHNKNIKYIVSLYFNNYVLIENISLISSPVVISQHSTIKIK